MSDKLTDDQVANVLAVLDEALVGGPWSTSPFLGLIGKKLQTIRDEFLQQQETMYGREKETSQQINDLFEKRAQMTKVYVALYAFDGGNLQSWERVIMNLPSHLTSRAIYANEDEVKALIRSKPNPVNDGYISMFVNPDDILSQPAEKISTDKLGKPLLALKHKAISLESLDIFVHQTGNYQWSNGRLIPVAT